MTPSIGDTSADGALRRRGTVVLGVAGGAATAVLLVALGTPGDDALTEPVWIDTAPASADASAQRMAALAAGGDGRGVENAAEEAGASMAAEEH